MVRDSSAPCRCGIPGVGNLFVPWATSRSSKVPAIHPFPADQKKGLRVNIKYFTANLTALTKKQPLPKN